MTDQQGWLRIEREFDANIDLVWQMWTDPELFKQWYGPNGAKIPVVEMDVSVGGVRKICMEMARPNGNVQMWFIGVFKEVRAPGRLVYTESMCDANGVIISAQSMGMPEGTPDVTEITVDLRSEGGKTIMTMIHAGVPEGSAAGGGWMQAFDKLGVVAGTTG